MVRSVVWQHTERCHAPRRRAIPMLLYHDSSSWQQSVAYCHGSSIDMAHWHLSTSAIYLREAELNIDVRCLTLISY